MIGRHDLSVHDPDQLIALAKAFFPQVLSYGDLYDHSSRRAKNLGQPLRHSLPILKRSDDIDIWPKLARIQTALRADMSPYYAWPSRILPLFEGEFLGIYRRIESESPT